MSSSLLERVIIAHRCRSTHHYIAIDALSQISGEDGEKWRDLLLLHNEALLDGAKAPDTKFKDFKNHVLHVSEGEWGGARDKAAEWYGEAVAALKRKNWSKAAYALGVLSHYYSDPIQPLHTGQTEEEGAIHRALEWSVAKSYHTLKARIDEKGYPNVKAGKGAAFVSDMVRDGADKSHPHYQTIIDHYDLAAGTKDPEAGLDKKLIDVLSGLMAYATAGFAVLISRAVEEAGVAAPKTHLTLPGYLATLDIPIRWVSRKLADAGEQRAVERMFNELQKTGKVLKTLPKEEKELRKLHAKTVLRTSLKELDAQPIGPLGAKHVPLEPRAAAIEAPAKPDRKAEKAAKAEAKRAEKAALAEKKQAEKDAKAKAKEAEKVAAAEAKATAEKAKADAKAVAKAEADKIKADVEAKKTETQKAKKKKSKPKAQKAEALPAIVSDGSAADEPPEIVYEAEETWTEPDDSPVDAADEDDGVADLVSDAAEAELELDAEERAELEAQLEAELQAEIDAELAAEDAEDIEQELAKEDAALINADKQDDPADDRHWRVGSLTPDSDIVEAPSIGRKTAERLGEIGIFTVGDLLETDCDVAAELLDVDYITEDTLIDWQDQAELMMTVAGLRTHDAQVLVGAGIRSADELANAAARDIFISATNFLSTPEGDRIVRDDEELEEDEVEHWIDLARQSAA
ncbi:MAG: DUF4332 domain-containing protein [Pseudomonadota bacterium]